MAKAALQGARHEVNSNFEEEGEQAKRSSLKKFDRTTSYSSEGGNPMEKPSSKETWMVDDTVCDLLVLDTREEQLRLQGRAEQELGRPQLLVSVDPYSRLIMAFKLSYKE